MIMSKPKPPRILISGYYGFSNIGDEAILLSLRLSLQQEMPGVELVVLSASPEETARHHGVRAIPRLGFWRILWELLHADLLISGGGSLFQDSTSSRSLYIYLSVVALGLLTRRPVMIYAQGIGPLIRPFNRWLTARLLERVSLICVRDEQSLDELAKLDMNWVAMDLTADPVLALTAASPDIGQRILVDLGMKRAVPESEEGISEGPLIGVSIRPWAGSEHLLQVLEEVLLRLVREGAKLILIPMHYPGDDAITEELRTRLSLAMEREDAKDGTVRGEAVNLCVLPGGYGVLDLISLIENFNLMIGVRLHALVFAAIASTPAIAISYDPKVDHFAARMKQACAGSIAEVQADGLYELACDCLAEEQAIRRQNRELSEELRREAQRSAERAARLVQRRRKR